MINILSPVLLFVTADVSPWSGIPLNKSDRGPRKLK